MKTVNVFVKPDKTVKIKCPYCSIVRTVSVDRFKDPKKINKIKCVCSKIFNMSFEFRRTYRKEIRLQGTYINNSTEGDEGENVIENLSMGGIGFSVVDAHNIAMGNNLLVVFRLDDERNTLISREVRVRKIKGNYIGTEFVTVGAYDKYLGFYLMS